MIVHIDCNSFYASCEIASHPELRGRPIVVANCNEAGGGIILALTPEAKVLGLKRGNPVFQVRNILKKHNVIVFPTNHKMYGEVSRYIMQLVRKQGIIQNFTQYSIDEFFGTLPVDDAAEVSSYVAQVKELIIDKTSIPVSCGCSQTYTLAKIATHYAKRFKGYDGICVLTPEKREAALAQLAISDVWGIGRAHYARMQYYGIHTALDFVEKNESWVKREFSVVGVRTWNELKGTPVIDINKSSQQRTLMHSRTFTYMTDEKEKLHTYLVGYATTAAHKLREEHAVCQSITVFISTNRHRQDLLQYVNSEFIRLATPTADTPEIIRRALSVFDKIYRPGYQYKKMGIILGDISDASAVQLDLFAETDINKSRKLMETLDSINQKYGPDTLRTAAMGTEEQTSEPPGFRFDSDESVK